MTKKFQYLRPLEPNEQCWFCKVFLGRKNKKKPLLLAAALQKTVCQKATVLTAAGHPWDLPLIRQPTATGEKSVPLDPHFNHLSNYPGRSSPRTLQLIRPTFKQNCGGRLITTPAHDQKKSILFNYFSIHSFILFINLLSMQIISGASSIRLILRPINKLCCGHIYVFY